VSAVLPSKKKARRRQDEGDGLPTIEVDVDDEVAIADVAEALVTAILAAAVESGGGGRVSKAKARPARAKKSASKRVAKKSAAKKAKGVRRAAGKK
jgi:hypothetical protein